MASEHRVQAHGQDSRSDLPTPQQVAAASSSAALPTHGVPPILAQAGLKPRATWACLLAAALVIVLADQACPDTLDALVVTSAVADLGTTEWALSRPGLHEVNPLLQGPAHRVLFKVAGTVAVVGTGRYLERRGHRGWSRAVRIGVVVLWGGLAVQNAVRARGTR